MGYLTLPLSSLSDNILLNINDTPSIPASPSHHGSIYNYNYSSTSSNRTSHIFSMPDDPGGMLIGEFNFEYFLITPFNHPKCGNILARSFANTADILIGHRGTGSWKSAYPKNNQHPRRTHIKENTILAFNTASTFGADYVEFDVQLTKDKIPIIYHDFLFLTSNFEIPINKIKLEQLLKHNETLDLKRKKLNNINTSEKNSKNKNKNKNKKNNLPNTNTNISTNNSDDTSQKNLTSFNSKRPKKKSTTTRIPRSESATFKSGKVNNLKDRNFDDAVATNNDNNINSITNDTNGIHMTDISEEKTSATTKTTIVAPSRPADDSIEGLNYLQDHYCTLKDAFLLAPRSLGFNIEVKYPNESECIEDGIETPVSINEFVDIVLKCVFDWNKHNRSIVFSSFHAEICSALALKQPQYPVLFLSTAGVEQYSDPRTDSLYQAIRFAKRENLLGIVTDSTVFTNCPWLINAVHKAGLIVMSYGMGNNDINQIELQRKFGIDGLIVDHVKYVRQYLDENPQF